MRIYKFIILTSQLTEGSRSSGKIEYTNDGFSNSKESIFCGGHTP